MHLDLLDHHASAVAVALPTNPSTPWAAVSAHSSSNMSIPCEVRLYGNGSRNTWRIGLQSGITAGHPPQKQPSSRVPLVGGGELCPPPPPPPPLRGGDFFLLILNKRSEIKKKSQNFNRERISASGSLGQLYVSHTQD